MAEIIWHETNMTSNTAPIPLKASASSEYTTTYGAYRAFNGINDNTPWTSRGTNTGWIQLDFGQSKKIDRVRIRARNHPTPTNNDVRMPRDFNVLGTNDGTNFKLLSSIREQTLWSTGEERIFNFPSSEYSMYRIEILTNNGDSYIDIGEITFGYAKYEEKILLQSNGKTYSLELTNEIYETKMTSNTTPAPLVASASSIFSTSYPVWKAFNGTVINGTDRWITTTLDTYGWIQIDYGTPRKVNIVHITSIFDASVLNQMIKDFDILGSHDGSNFFLLSKVTNQINWSVQEQRSFLFNNDNEYRYYRIKINTNNGGTASSIGDILYGYREDNVLNLPVINKNNFTVYGSKDMSIPESYKKINYILQDTVSENEQGLWTTQLNRKPLSIKFD